MKEDCEQRCGGVLSTKSTASYLAVASSLPAYVDEHCVPTLFHLAAPIARVEHYHWYLNERDRDGDERYREIRVIDREGQSPSVR